MTFGSGVAEVRAVDGVDPTIAAGEYVAVLGPSRCGKSTLLHLGGGLELPTAGHVRFDGDDLSNMVPFEWPRCDAATWATCSSRSTS